MKRPTLAECLGVSTRWQALAVLSYLLGDGCVSAECRAAADVVAGADSAERLRENARLMVERAWVWSTASRVCSDSWIDVRLAHIAIYRLIAWELLAELRERRARERWEADVAPRNCCGRCDRCGCMLAPSGACVCDLWRRRDTPRTSCAGCGRKLEEVK